jgi:hypothetical protein
MTLPKHIILFVFFSFAAVRSNAQFFDFSGSRDRALANASAALTGCWSVWGNQAGLAEMTHPEVALAFQNRFLVAELSDRLGLFAFPLQSNVLALSFYQFGQIPFRREKFGLAFARHVSPRIAFGLQFNYSRFYLPEANRSAGSAGLEVGVQYVMRSNLTWGLHLANPYQTGVPTYSGKVDEPSRLNLGFRYDLSDVFVWVSEIEADTDRHFRIRNGLEYRMPEKFFLRIGVATHPYQLSSGIGFRLRQLTVDLGNSFHANLGNSPSVSFRYPLGK